MAGNTRNCKVCGVDYPYCKTANRAGTYRWQDVACCPEHGSIYLARVIAARSGEPEPVEEKVSDFEFAEPVVYDPEVDEWDDDEEDEFYD